ncbi:Serine/threonine-protein kinase rio1 [Saitoella coloradoensis]
MTEAARIDDAPAPSTEYAAARDPQFTYIDQIGYQPEEAAELSDDDDFDEDEEEDDFYEDDLNDADWGEGGKDFTKAYNRQRQLVAVANQQAPVYTAPRTNTQVPQAAAAPTATVPKAATQNEEVALSKLASRINLNESWGGKASGGGDRQNATDKADRATSEQVLDPRTRMILLKMINRGIVYEINGCISTGKEANVYHATTESGEHRAIKIYKTSILVFKDRDRYVSGEYRFRNGYSKRNPRKMVKVWAEKEMRNLKRLYSAGIPSPEPILLKLHVLVMAFLGNKAGWAYPRLKDAVVPDEEYQDLYDQLCRLYRIMYQVCHLVHADLSEYNILYKKGIGLYIIDVSQSVEHDHPRASEFLRMDITNITDYFRRRGASTLPTKILYDFITDPNHPTTHPEMQTILDDLHQTLEHEEEGARVKRERDEIVWEQSYIPQTLEEVYDYERDADMVAAGEGGGLIYKDLVKLPEQAQSSAAVVTKEDAKKTAKEAKKEVANDELSKEEVTDGEEVVVLAPRAPVTIKNKDKDPASKPAVKFTADTKKESVTDDASSEADAEDDSEGEDEYDAVSIDDTSSDSDSDSWVERPAAEPKGKRFQDKDEKKERKKAAKDERAEKRKTKLPKKVKKAKIKQSSKKK